MWDRPAVAIDMTIMAITDIQSIAAIRLIVAMPVALPPIDLHPPDVPRRRYRRDPAVTDRLITPWCTIGQTYN